MHDPYLAERLKAVLDEPLDVRQRLAVKLRELGTGIGDRDIARCRALCDVACLLERGSFIPAGASIDWM